MIFATPLTAQAAGPIRPFQIGNWSGGTYTDDSTGQFSHCAVYSTYQSGIALHVSVTRQFGWMLGFSRPDWRLAVGQNIPLDLTFDGRGPYHFYARVLTPNLAAISMPPTSDLVRRFRAAQQMTAGKDGQVSTFALTSTSQMLPALVDCVRQSTGVAAPRPASPQPVLPSTANTAAPSTPAPAPVSADLHMEAMEIATNFILAAKLDGPKILPRSETPTEFASLGASWKANDTAGSVRIIPADGSSRGIDVAAAVIAADAKNCKGKFASARSSDLIDSEVVFHGVSMCEDSSGPRSVQYFIVPRNKGGFTLFSVTSGETSSNKPTSVSEERVGLFRKAALSSAN
jgi:hypothetical protein